MNDVLINLLPVLIMTIIFFLFAIPMARRKEKSIGFCALILIPLIGPFIIFYIASLTDKENADRLAALEQKMR